jgi:pimeloyl-ACP methyl ester carboxylesterase
MVDIVAHSMGGLISRYYIARLMPERDVAQLVMLGSPHGGSDCSGLPSALGMYGPASLELRPAYLRQIFNGAVTERRGVPFAMLAGNAIVQNFKAPCTGVPSDIVVAQDSAAAIPGPVTTLPVLHTDMTKSPEVFERFVRPLLQRPRSQFAQVADPRASAETVVPAQFTQVASGRVPPGGSVDVEVNLDEVAIASFALFDPSRSLAVTIRGASGNVITLNARDHGLIQVDDPATLVHLGYGFDKPRPGPWRVTLQAKPGLGADYALSARVAGGAQLRAQASELTPAVGQAVALTATLELASRTLTDVAMHAVIHGQDGRKERIDLGGSAMPLAGVWRPAASGLYGVDVVAKGRSGELRIERTAFLAVEAR